MKTHTKYFYQKRIKQLEEENTRLHNEIYEYRTACSEIYAEAIEVLKQEKTGLAIWYLLGRLKRCWKGA